MANSLDWRVSILDILDTEREWPGLMDDLSTESWQRRLVKDQLDGTGKGTPEDEQLVEDELSV